MPFGVGDVHRSSLDLKKEVATATSRSTGSAPIRGRRGSHRFPRPAAPRELRLHEVNSGAGVGVHEKVLGGSTTAWIVGPKTPVLDPLMQLRERSANDCSAKMRRSDSYAVLKIGVCDCRPFFSTNAILFLIERCRSRADWVADMRCGAH